MKYGSIFRATVAAFVLLPGGATQAAQGLFEVDERLRQCLVIADAGDRLQCFEALANERLESPARSRPSTGGVPDSERKPEDDAVTAEIDRVEERIHGERVFYLSNGQVWEEVDAGRGRYRENMQVRIEQAALGSFMLRVEGLPASRVRRIR